MGARTAVTRSTEWVEREYGDEKWPAIEGAIAEVCAAEGSAPDPARVVAQVARAEMGVLPAESDMIVNGHPERLSLSLATGAYQSLVVETVLSHCTPETDLVVELGSGWGRNLMCLWLAGGPAGARYVAAEFTETGRRASAQLAALTPAMSFAALPFDYRAPDLTALAPGRTAVVFTAHSIEQVSELPDVLIEAIAGTAASITCVHFEPVGWQIDDSLAGSSREYARHHDYNLNLVELLGRHADARTISVDGIQAEHIGLNPDNATSVVTWSSAA